MKKAAFVALALAVSLPGATIASSASAQPDYRWRGGPEHRDWDPARSYREPRGRRHAERRMTRDDYVYRGGDGRYYCRRPDGTTGLVVGAIGGGLIGNAIGGDTLGTLLGAAAGGALGRSIQRGQVRCR